MMNFVQEQKGYCNNNNEEDQDEDHQKERIREPIKLPFSFSSSSSSVSSFSWPLGPFDSQEPAAAATNFDKKIELIDLSLGNNNNNNIEKEHMFDKVVTPSDVGKLNRLVIPKQHAERYFPLDSSSNEKGLLLNFEDRNGKAWRFRYSYWNSSQSYVMTKGWSRFVKDKKLDPGDIVSFQRGVGELGKDHLYIDWRRRPRPDNLIVPDPTLLAQMQIQNQLRWDTRFYSFPQSLSLSRNYEQLQRMNYNTIHPYYHQQQQYYIWPSGSQQIDQGGHMPMVIDSVPVVPGKSTAAKRLRLFGVNMECPIQDDDESPATSAPILATRQAADEYSNKGKSSMSFDLDL